VLVLGTTLIALRLYYAPLQAGQQE
jgi:hypothetical protein